MNNQQIIGNELELQFCIPFSKMEKKQLTFNQTEILIRLLPLSHQEGQELCNAIEKMDYVFAALRKRLQVLTINIEPKALVFIRMCMDSIGKCIMLLYYIQWAAKSKQKREISLDDICNWIFPIGFPSEKDIEKAWDSQKCKNGNMVDIPAYYTSIMF